MKKHLFKVINGMTNFLLSAFLGKAVNLKEESRKGFVFSLSHKLYVTKAIKLTALSLLVILAISCKDTEDDIVYEGIVKRKTTDCSGGLGFPVIIKVHNSLEYDSIYTATLPENYQTIGSELEFKMRPLKTEDEFIFCNTQIINPKFMVVYDVKDRN